MVGCANANAQAVLLNPAGTGSIVATFAQISKTDEIWYDPASGRYFVTGANAAGHRVFDVISDSNDQLLQSVLLPVGDASNPHSIAVDPLTGDVFVPLAGNTDAVGGNAVCSSGCVAVYANAVPEPATVSLMLASLAGFVGWRTRLRPRPRG
jgi:DNA-binding beta-propeller fold protein YncE